MYLGHVLRMPPTQLLLSSDNMDTTCHEKQGQLRETCGTIEISQINQHDNQKPEQTSTILKSMMETGVCSRV